MKFQIVQTDNDELTGETMYFVSTMDSFTKENAEKNKLQLEKITS